ncbi:hypothetical protein FK514_30020, partial [Klebsiella pneumoniae]|nr:hypothetical protein [Klebsiella pneumoniae]
MKLLRHPQTLRAEAGRQWRFQPKEMLAIEMGEYYKGGARAQGDQGYPDDYSLNLWLKKIAGTGFDLELIGHHMNRNENHP